MVERREENSEGRATRRALRRLLREAASLQCSAGCGSIWTGRQSGAHPAQALHTPSTAGREGGKHPMGERASSGECTQSRKLRCVCPQRTEGYDECAVDKRDWQIE